MEQTNPGKVTNEEVVRYLMNNSPHGALCQVFIIEGIRYYAEQITKSPKPTEHGKEFISAIIWHDIATDVLKKLEEVHSGQKSPQNG